MQTMLRALAMMTSLLFATQAYAAYPERTVRLIVGFPPGGPADVAARILSEELQRRLGQTFVVENRTGASGIIAAQAVAKAPADGYTLLIATNSLVLNAMSNPNAGYQTARDFVTVGLLATQASAVAVHSGLPVQTLEDLKRLASNSNLSFATSGQGTSSHALGTYLFNGLWKTDMSAIPYRGAGPADLAVASGEPPVGFTTVGGVIRLQEDGKVRVIAVANANRLSSLPDTPTMKELGYPHFGPSWTAVFGPAGMPKSVVQTLNTAINEALAVPAIRTKFQAQAMDPPEQMSLQDVEAFMVNETENWRRIAASSEPSPIP